jgi:hypothetical protein
MSIWYIVRTIGIFYDPLLHFVLIWYIFSRFGIVHQEKSGNPGRGLDLHSEIGFTQQVSHPGRNFYARGRTFVPGCKFSYLGANFHTWV